MQEPDLMVHPLPGFPPAVGTALWMLADTRRRTFDTIDGLTDDQLDQVPAGLDNSIGSLLYHLAAIEADWLYADILQVAYPAWMDDWFPLDVREEDGRLTPVPGYTVAQHLQRLATVRVHLLEDLADLTDADYRLERGVESGVTTPEWVLHHLRQHEAEHRGQIQSIRTALR
ncbi:MAG: DinB family protein [Thermoanaerobaculales bacterium]|nr:DinB family protein [Thermoanaerobaculales bacterium]